MDEEPQAVNPVILQKNRCARHSTSHPDRRRCAAHDCHHTAPAAGATIRWNLHVWRWNASDPEGQLLLFQVRPFV